MPLTPTVRAVPRVSPGRRPRRFHPKSRCRRPEPKYPPPGDRVAHEAARVAAEQARERPPGSPRLTVARAVIASVDRLTTPAQAVALCCAMMGVDPEALRTGRRSRDLTWARAVAAYALLTVAKASGPEAGAELGSSHVVAYEGRRRVAEALAAERRAAARERARAFAAAA